MIGMMMEDWEPLVEEWMDKLADMPARLRRKLVPSEALRNAATRGSKGVVITHGPSDPRETAKMCAAAAYELGGVWSIGSNFNAAPVGCQDCGHADWDGDKVTCGWEIAPRESNVAHPYGSGPSYQARLAHAVESERNWRHTHPPAFLDYRQSKGAVGGNGHIDTDLIYKQCPKCDPLGLEDE